MYRTLMLGVAALLICTACSGRKTPGAPVEVQNVSDHAVQVFWTADECDEADVGQGVGGICHRQALAPNQVAQFAYPKSYSDKHVTIHRDHTQCTLPGDRNDVSVVIVKDGDFVRTTGCILQKGRAFTLQSANPGQSGDTAAR